MARASQRAQAAHPGPRGAARSTVYKQPPAARSRASSEPTWIDDLSSAPARRAIGRVVAVAWLSIVLGLAMQTLILVSKVSIGSWPPYSMVAIDLVQGVTWSFFVCAGVGLGTTIAKSQSYLGGIIGMIAAPIAMGIAKGAQKVMKSLLGAPDTPAIMPLTTLGVIRALEYGLLGWALAWMVSKDENRLMRFLGVGAVIGVIFGGGATGLTFHLARLKGVALTSAQMLTTALNEIVFPIGCSLVVFIALVVGRHLKLISAAPKPARLRRS